MSGRLGNGRMNRTLGKLGQWDEFGGTFVQTDEGFGYGPYPEDYADPYAKAYDDPIYTTTQQSPLTQPTSNVSDTLLTRGADLLAKFLRTGNGQPGTITYRPPVAQKPSMLPWIALAAAAIILLPSRSRR